jgi:hypothetical protein
MSLPIPRLARCRGQFGTETITINPILSSSEQITCHLLAPIRNGDPTLSVPYFMIVLRCRCLHEGRRRDLLFTG